MKFQQLRYLVAVHENGLNITAAARQLHTSQPGVSRQLKLLEEELGFQLFEREGRALTRTTAAGEEIISRAGSILREMQNIRRTSAELRKADGGTLSIATTHTQARYVLPEPVAQLRRRFPKVQVSLHQGSPDQVVQMLLDGTADIGLATEALSEPEDLVSLPCYEWEHVIVMRAEHPLAEVEKITLEQLANETLISYHPAFTGRRRIDAAFAQRRIKPNIALEAIDSDVIKTYVKSGLGVGIVAEMAVRDDPPGGELVHRPAGHLFGRNVTRVAFRRGAYLRGYVLTFAELLSDRLTRPLLLRALAGTGENYDL